jgi:hypothetical protein
MFNGIIGPPALMRQLADSANAAECAERARHLSELRSRATELAERCSTALAAHEQADVRTVAAASDLATSPAVRADFAEHVRRDLRAGRYSLNRPWREGAPLQPPVTL